MGMGARAVVLGSGSFGTALANVLASKFQQVRLWGREAAVRDAVNGRHENPAFLPGIPVRPNVVATLDLGEALAGAEFVCVAIPSQATRDVLGRARELLPAGVPIITVAKGIENGTLLTMTEVMEDCLPESFHPWLAVLSGPSFAKEMAAGAPTVVTVAAQWERVARQCQAALNTESFRTYTSRDVVGVQMGGALKNVIALAAGMCDGLGLGNNARAALITRGLAEISRIAVRKGGNPLTLSGLSGLGDLVLTCTGDLSRNRQVGMALGRGQPLADILKDMKQVAEGVKTAVSARDLALKTGVELPICQQVYAILHEGKSARAALVELMTRPPRAETE